MQKLLFASITFAVVVLVVSASLGDVSLPEESWYDSNDLLQRLHEDSTPLASLIQMTSPESIAAADKAKAAQDAIVFKASDDEEKLKRDEAEHAKQANELNKKQLKLQSDAEIANAKATNTAAADASAAAEEATQATQATVKASEESVKLQKQYDAYIKQMGTETSSASAASQARAEAVEKQIIANNNTIIAEKAAQKQIMANMKDAAAALKTKKAMIATAYKDRTAVLKEVAEKGQASIAAEGVKISAEYKKAMKGNNQTTTAEQKAISDEALANHKAAKKAMRDIDTKFNDIKAVNEKKQKAWVQKQALSEKATKTHNKKFKEKFQKEAAKADEEYKKAMVKVEGLKQAVATAKLAFNASTVQAAKEEAAEQKLDAAADSKDDAMAECATDGSECQDATTFACVKVNDKNGPWMSADMYTCTKTKPSQQAYGGVTWAGVPPPLPKTPLPKATPECKAMRASFKASPFGKYYNKGSVPPFQGVACSDSKDFSKKKQEHFFSKKKQAFLAVFAMAEACPPWCMPHTATSDGLTADTNGVCLTSDVISMFVEQIEDLPVYKNMGTNNKIPAGPPSDLCRMATEFSEGFGAGGSNAPTAAPTPPPTTAAPTKPVYTEVVGSDPDAYRKYIPGWTASDTVAEEARDSKAEAYASTTAGADMATVYGS